MLRIMSFFLFLLLSTHTVAEVENKNLFTEDKLGISITADHSQFTIKLKSNPTTGYSWFLREYNSSLITPLKHHFEVNPDKKLMGAPGYELWTFNVKKNGFTVPQQTILRFVYARPWEGMDQSKQIVFRVSTLPSLKPV